MTVPYIGPWRYQLIHKLPWWALKRVCSLCAEFGHDPRDKTYWDNLLATSSAKTTGPPTVTYKCDHLQVTGNLATAPTAWCGCEMTRTPLTMTSASALTLVR